MNKYLKEYEWSNIFAMLENHKAPIKETDEDCTGKLVVITGATSGIGYETARLFASRGANLICVNRNAAKSARLQAEIEAAFGVSCRCHIADFSRLADVHAVAKELVATPQAIDVLIHNAGVYNTTRTITADGLEEVFQVNYLASFILTYALRERLVREQKARILLVNSEGHRFAIEGLKLDDLGWTRRHYTGLRSYGSAKTAQLLAMRLQDRYFAGSGVTINAMHPGDVRTAMGENNGALYRFFKHTLINGTARDPVLSAKALYFLGVARELAGVSGRFFHFTTEETPAPHALDDGMAAELWEASLRLGGLA
ncbi:MAG: SDR family NAD(P)-dependent oxidoreductase [Myxococcota bacterium]